MKKNIYYLVFLVFLICFSVSAKKEENLSLKISNHGLQLDFNTITGSATLVYGTVSFVQCESKEFKVKEASINENALHFTVTNNTLTLQCRYSIISDDTGKYFEFAAFSENEFEDEVMYPEAFDVKKGDKQIDAYCEGYTFNVEDECPYLGNRPLYGGIWNSMSFWAIENSNGWLLSAVYTNFDAELKTSRSDDGLCRTNIVWIPQMGKWGYERKLRFYVGNRSKSSISDICSIYRKMAEEKGLVKTLKQKAENNKTVLRLAGCANVWLWNDDAMYKLYDMKAIYKIPTEEQTTLRRSIADEMKSSGMTNVLWSIFDENIDKKTVEHIRQLGYLTTSYDVYTDVIPNTIADKIPETRRRRCEHRMPYWPGGIARERDGSLSPAWKLTGIDGKMYDQHRMCDVVAIECAKNYVPKHYLNNKLDGIFIDVSMTGAHECYSNEHPLNRTKSWENKNKLFELMGEYGLLRGSENGHENGVRNYEYSEGKMSLPLMRFNDSGRKMTTLHENEEDIQFMKKYMLNPQNRVPLWELVFHDCETSYWYWGDCTNSCPPLMKLRDLFCNLYGLPPLYSFAATQWNMLKEEIVESYKRTVLLARNLAMCRMTDFEYLSADRMVQKTVFSDGTQIIVNFGDADFIYEDKIIGEMDKIVIFNK